jgi:hypothetical protein
VKKGFYTAAVVLILVISGYAYWSNSDNASGTEGIFPRYVIGDMEEFGKKTAAKEMLLHFLLIYTHMIFHLKRHFIICCSIISVLPNEEIY